MKNRTAYFGVFIALALILSYVESLVPFYFGVPGMKAGLANIVIILALYYLGTKEAFILSVARVLVAGFLFGNLYSIAYSLAGGLLSITVMAICKKRKLFSVKGISIIGGVCHNIGQMILAMLVVESWSIAFYIPFLLIAGLAAGLLVGVVAYEIGHRIQGGLFE